MGAARERNETAAGSGWFDRVLLGCGALLLVLATVWLVNLIGSVAHTPVALPAATIGPEPAMEVGEAPEAPEAAQAGPILVDDAFGVTLPGRALRRVVQVLQWREVASVPLALGDEVVRELGEYQLLWSERLIDSSRFAQAQGHVNPPAPPYRSASMGPATLLQVDAQAEAGWQDVPAESVRLPDNLAAVFRSEGRWLVTAPEGDVPEAGDLRVRFEVLPVAVSSEASTAAVQAVEEAHEDVDFAGLALRWIARVAAFILALVGAGLVLHGAARLVPPERWLRRLSAVAVLALSAWAAVGVVLIAALLARLW